MNDLISRQAAIKAIECNAYRHTYIDQILDIIKSMPSAHPLDPCETCVYKGKGWDEDPCDGCTGTESKYEPDNGWVPVSEKLPELNDDGASDPVLLCWADRQIVVGFYAGNETFYAQSFPFATDGTARIIAWMPLPEPMKLEED